MRSGTLKNVLSLAAIAAMLMFTVAIGVGTYLGYRWFTDNHLVSTGDDGIARANVVQATLYARNDLRVGQLSGIVQGVGGASRVWGWLNSSQIVKAPFKVDYFVPLSRLKLSNFSYDRSSNTLSVNAPEPVIEQANIDFARTTLTNMSGWFVTRGAMAEMNKKVAASAQSAAGERAESPENRAKAREFARGALQRLFGGVLDATGMAARVEVRFPTDPVPNDGRRWDTSRSLDEVLRDHR